MMPKMRYGIEEHRHRFSVRAAARAAQRGLRKAKVAVLRKALENSGVAEYLRTCDGDAVDEAGFDAEHRVWCQRVASSLREAGVENVAFGRAAKLIAVYLKSAVVMDKHATELARVAHPPIDGILLRNIAACADVRSDYKREWARVRWTQLDEDGYYRLISQLRAAFGARESFWMLERYWTVTDEPGQ